MEFVIRFLTSSNQTFYATEFNLYHVDIDTAFRSSDIDGCLDWLQQHGKDVIGDIEKHGIFVERIIISQFNFSGEKKP